jgi:hypothetical protein
MADLVNSKPKHYSNWEYGACRPPEKIARRLLEMYNERVAKTDAAPVGSYQRPFSKRRIYESELMPIVQIRAPAGASGLPHPGAKRLTSRRPLQDLGMKLQPSQQQVEQMIPIFGTPPTPRSGKRPRPTQQSSCGGKARGRVSDPL